MLFLMRTLNLKIPEPSRPPSNIKCEAVSSSSLVITWSPPVFGANGDIISYRVAYGSLPNLGKY